MSEPRFGGQAVVGLLLAAVAVATFIAGRLPLSIFVGVVCLLSYGELRGLLAASGRVPTFVAGGAGVAAFLWLGYHGRLASLPWVPAVLVLVLLAFWVVMHEATGRAQGAAEDVSGTLAAAAIIGVMGAHVLLIRSIPRVGFRGLLAFGLMVLLNDAFAFFGGRAFGRRPLLPSISPSKTSEGAMCGFLASVAVGAVVGFVLNPPFEPRSGLAFGAAIGVLVPLGDLAFSAVKRGAGRKESGRIFGPLGGVLDAVDALLFCAPAFYWALRTIAL
jgi:phosphatidate cytidylyltransferase